MDPADLTRLAVAWIAVRSGRGVVVRGSGEDIERDFERLRSTMIEMMKSLFNRGRPAPVRGSSFAPAIDVFETSSAVIVLMEIAGTDRKDIEVHLDGRRLRIAGARRVAAPVNAQRCHQMEIESGPFERWVSLDFVPSRDAIEAVYQDGFLHITIPKRGDPSTTSVPVLTE
ncbi:MAG: Hsp20/alpha crystallin family protein [Candidatus Methylomirabilales bacterium]